MKSIRDLPLSRRATAAAALLAIAGGIVTLAGWCFDVPRLIDWFGLGVTMKANPAICATLVGSALLTLALSPSRQLFLSVTALGGAAIGAATLVQHLTGVDLGIDTLLFWEAPNQLATAAPGRMGPPASLSFSLLGVALVLITRQHKRTALGFALVVLCLSTLSFVGYWYGAEPMYTIPRLTGISLQMTLILMALSIGTIAAVPEIGLVRVLSNRDDSSLILFRLLPAALLIPFATGWLRIQGQDLGLFETKFGTALRTLVEMTLLCALAWWAARAIQQRDRQRFIAEQARDNFERRFRTVLDSSAVPFTILEPVSDEGGKVVDFTWAYMNPAAAQTLQRPAHELVGRKISEALPGSWKEPGLFDRYVSVLERKNVEEFELQSDANGIKGWFHVVASAFDHHVAVWFADVTIRKQQELELRRADRRKDEFLATLAHELRNPLAPIRQASFLMRKSGLDEAQRQWCSDVVERQTRHMALLLDDLLDVSRITRGMLQLRRAETPAQSIVHSAVETVRPLIDARKQLLKIELPDEEMRVNVDALRLSQAIGNLLSNAAKYTDRGGSISLDVRDANGAFVVRVQDTGIGIDAENMGELFRMFSQIKADAERSEGGLGIGLALTKGLVELHGGTIEVQSPGRGRGSTFTIVIPDAVGQHLQRLQSPDVAINAMDTHRRVR